MQNLATLKDLGFLPTAKQGEYIWRGKFQRFIAIPKKDHSDYVTVLLVSKEVDKRPLSPRKGHYYRGWLSDCSRNGSVKRILSKYDVPDDKISVNDIFLLVKS